MAIAYSLIGNSPTLSLNYVLSEIGKYINSSSFSRDDIRNILMKYTDVFYVVWENIRKEGPLPRLDDQYLPIFNYIQDRPYSTFTPQVLNGARQGWKPLFIKGILPYMFFRQQALMICKLNPNGTIDTTTAPSFTCMVHDHNLIRRNIIHSGIVAYKFPDTLYIGDNIRTGGLVSEDISRITSKWK